MFSLILPTYNEAKNLPDLLPKIEKELDSVPHEIIIVDDDSPDKTWEVGHELAKKYGKVHSSSQASTELRVIRRIGRRGLSSAIMEGFLAANGDVLAVMDADGQHDLTLLTELYKATNDSIDIAIGSRYIEGGSVGEWDERRHLLSRIATGMAKGLCKVRVEDPMSGFFAIKQPLFEKVIPKLNPKGFKMLLDILVHVPKRTTVKEIPFTFGVRTKGESKLSKRVQIEFLEYLYDVTIGRFIPLMFVKYCIVGTLGVFVHMSTYLIFSNLFRGAGDLTIFNFSLAVIIAVETAILFNYLLNNIWTFAHARLHGMQSVYGFIKYNIACTFGALANVAVSTYLFSIGIHELLSVFIGAFVGVIWNYTMSRMFTWKKT